MPELRYPQRSLHTGYRYQDLVAAMAMAVVLSEGRGAVSVETKRFAGDRFDDVVLASAVGDLRRAQVKHRAGGTLTRSLFESDAEGLGLEVLMTETDSDDRGGLHVVTTLASDSERVPGFVPAPGSQPFVPGVETTRWRLDADNLWPRGTEPTLRVAAGARREDFVAFCQRLIVESDATPMSGTLADPGPLESALIARLRDQVGVEQYPNRTAAVDVASRLLEVASSLRTRNERRVDFIEIARECGLRIDRGRVVQAFPLNRRRYVAHVPLRDALVGALDTHQRIVVQGPPGAGKSWVLEALAQDLRGRGWVVARHYCFLEPGDPDVGKRIAIEAMTANLTAELLDDDRLAGVRAGLGGELSGLQRVIVGAAEELSSLADCSETRIALIVDGLDHVARVDPLAGAAPVSPDDLVTQLALLELPECAMLIVGSQPGGFLEPLRERGAHTIRTPPLDLRHTAALLARQGVFRELRARGIGSDHASTLAAAHRQAAGNPLYVGFLGQQVLRSLTAGHPALPSEVIDAVAAPHGDLEAYYTHLISTVEHAPDGGLVAEHLALTDFPLTSNELAEILPQVGRQRLERVVSHLSPVLDEVGMQGGLRIHHESFRRFIVARLAAERRPLRALLDPVIGWLDGRGFFADDRAFRFVLPLLRRAGRNAEVLARVGADFVARSVIELQPQAVVQGNLRLAAGVAAELADFPALARIAELQTAATVAYDEKLSDPSSWGAAVIELDRGERMGERLLYDGRPTWPREPGLRLCALVDGAGGVAPWATYLDMPELPSNTTRTPAQDERYWLDELRGTLRTRDANDAIGSVAEWLDDTQTVNDAYLLGVADEVAFVLGASGLEAVIGAAAAPTDRARAWLELRLAEELAGRSESTAAHAAGQRALDAGLPARAVRRLLDVRMPAHALASACPAPSELVPDLLATTHDADEPTVDVFLSSVLVAAAAGDDLEAVQSALAGEGYYRAWLRFCCHMAVAARRGAGIVAALAELVKHTEPFVGQPRACDLYAIEEISHETFRRAANLIPDVEWPEALGHLRGIARGTTTYLNKSPNGPLTIWALLEVLLPYAAALPLDALRTELDRAWRNEYYEYHAEAALLLGRLDFRAGHSEAVAEALIAAGRYLASYGFHKDVTVFGLIEALEPIRDPGFAAEVSKRFRRLQPLCERAYRHSDGRETSHAPGSWFRAFARHSPGAAASALTDTVLEDKPGRTWLTERALGDLLVSNERVPPLLHHLLWRCIPGLDSKRWLGAVERLAAVDDVRAREAFAEVAAAADGDTEGPSSETAEIVRRFAEARGWPVPHMDTVPERRRRGAAPAAPTLANAKEVEPTRGPFFTDIDTPLALLVRMRNDDLDSYERPLDAPAFADELIDCLRLFLQEQDVDVVALVEAFCHGQPFLRSRAAILESLADAFSDRPATAAELLTLAWTTSQSGWDPFGGLEHGQLLRRAFERDSVASERRLAKEFAWQLQRARYGVGLTRRAAEAMILAERPRDALSCWDASAEVVEERLPPTGAERLMFAAPGPDLDEPTSDRAFAGLLGALVHAADFERRGAALAGIAELLDADATLAAAACEPLWCRDATFTATLAVARLLELLAQDGHNVEALAEWLPAIAAAPGFGLHRAGAALLEATGSRVPRPAAPLPVRDRTVTANELDDALVWDERRRVERLSRIWQPYARVVAARFWSMFDADRDATLNVIEEQFETQVSRSARWLPPWPIHRWESELFEVALHDTIGEFIGRLVRSGRWPRGNDDWLHEFLSADIAAAVARARSRQLRPEEVPLPDDRDDGEGPPKHRASGPYAGWLRVALVESEIRADEFERTGRLSCVRSGLWNGPGTDDDVSPLCAASVDTRWHSQNQPEALPTTGRLAIRWSDHHMVAWDTMLSLEPGLLTRLGLRPADMPKAFDLVDAEGRAGAVLRRWRMRPYSYDYPPPLPMISGSELLLRPDLARTVESLTEAREVTRVTKRALSYPEQ